MCDYSLHNVASRPAEVGDKLITHKFNVNSCGFAAVGDSKVAVCLMPGTEIVFEEEAVFKHAFGYLLRRFGFGMIGANMARFRQINLDKAYCHHDALEFANGKIVLLTRLCPGQRATVLQLPTMHQRTTVERAGHKALVVID